MPFSCGLELSSSGVLQAGPSAALQRIALHKKLQIWFWFREHAAFSEEREQHLGRQSRKRCGMTLMTLMTYDGSTLLIAYCAVLELMTMKRL